MDRGVPPDSSTPRTSGMAISSLVLGISSFLCWIFTGLPAIILGAIALRDIKRSGDELKGEGLAIAGIVTGSISMLIIIPAILIALLLPAIHAAREAARRNMSMNNMKQMVLAMYNHSEQQGTLPAAGSADAPGSQLSWRVHVLPYLEEQALYEQFHLDEPWDSEHNRALIAQMPEIFQSPGKDLPAGETAYLAVTGPGTAFGDGTVGPTLADFSDGTSNTIMLVEADPSQSVEWTKPEDWEFDPNNPMARVAASRPGGFLVAFADGSVQFIDENTDPQTIKAMMTRDGGEQVMRP